LRAVDEGRPQTDFRCRLKAQPAGAASPSGG
jgi:hypothetical protein